MEKRFLVVEVCGSKRQFISIKGRFDDERKAAIFAQLCKENNEAYDYYVAEMKMAVVK